MAAGNSGNLLELLAPLGSTGLATRRHLRRLSLYVLRVLLTALGEGSHVHATGTVEMSNVM
ncbi:hypothetical protein DEO72_LG10g2011 [Vigna unguiculata]|uniref:Uncharacterized protein n=1 Tax=Vigna unguiculata TaxID=3917 RepID=A0A4D6NE07_VIGUN|nr:hypothetical protein DEO72_LG10g2011 [Vigna unguiculata]